MLSEDRLTVLAVLVSIAGITAIYWAGINQETVETSLGKLDAVSLQAKVSFQARIEKQEQFLEFDRLKLFDGNQATGILPSSLRSRIVPGQKIYRFEARLSQKEPTVELEILQVNPLD